MLNDVLTAYRQIKAARAKDKQLRELKATPLNYIILKDLINTARYDVVIHVKMTDGTELDIRREDRFDKLQQRRDETW